MHKCSYVHLDICAAGWGQGQVGGLGGIQTWSEAGRAGGRCVYVQMYIWTYAQRGGRWLRAAVGENLDERGG